VAVGELLLTEAVKSVFKTVSGVFEGSLKVPDHFRAGLYGLFKELKAMEENVD
jgi:hypothetical protein